MGEQCVTVAETNRIGGRKTVKSHHGAVYQTISDMHKADRKGLSTLKG